MNEPSWTLALQVSEKDSLLHSFCKQNYDFHVYGFRVVSTGEHTYRSFRSDSPKDKDCYLNALEIKPFGCISGVLDFLLYHYAKLNICR